MKLIANAHDMNLYKSGIEKINKGYLILDMFTDRYANLEKKLYNFAFPKKIWDLDPSLDEDILLQEIKKQIGPVYAEIYDINEGLKDAYTNENVEALKIWAGTLFDFGMFGLYDISDTINQEIITNIKRIKKDKSMSNLLLLESGLQIQSYEVKALREKWKKLILDSIPPAGEGEFNIQGIKVLNPFRFPEKRIRIIVQAIDASIKILKRKGVEVKPFLNTIYIRPYQAGEVGVGYAHRNQKKMTLVRNKSDDKYDISYLIGIFIHEIGHLIEDQMAPEALNNYREPWKKIEKEVDEELIRVEGKIKGEAFKRIVQYKGDLKQVKKHFTKEQLNKIHSWLQVDGSTQYSYVTPSNFAWWFRAKKETVPLLEAIKDPELMAKYMGRMIETKGNDQKVVLEYETEFVEKFGDKSDWFYHKWLGEENRFYILWDVFKYKLKGDRTTFARESDLFKEKIKGLGIPSEYGHTNEAEDWAETFAHYILAPEKLSENALYRIKRALWLTQDKNKKVIDRIARSIPK